MITIEMTYEQALIARQLFSETKALFNAHDYTDEHEELDKLYQVFDEAMVGHAHEMTIDDEQLCDCGAFTEFCKENHDAGMDRVGSMEAGTTVAQALQDGHEQSATLGPVGGDSLVRAFTGFSGDADYFDGGRQGHSPRSASEAAGKTCKAITRGSSDIQTEQACGTVAVREYARQFACFECLDRGRVDCAECDDGVIECCLCEGRGHDGLNSCEECLGEGYYDCMTCNSFAYLLCSCSKGEEVRKSRFERSIAEHGNSEHAEIHRNSEHAEITPLECHDCGDDIMGIFYRDYGQTEVWLCFECYKASDDHIIGDKSCFACGDDAAYKIMRDNEGVVFVCVPCLDLDDEILPEKGEVIRKRFG